MARSAKPRKRKPASQRSKLPRYVVKLYDDDFFDEEDAEVLRFDSFDDAVECCADLNIPFFVDTGNKKLVFWFVHTSLPVLVPGVPQPVVTGRDEPHCSGCDTGNLPSDRCGAGDIHGDRGSTPEPPKFPLSQF
uniref:IS91 ORF2 n=1 Tax=Escherichia coli O169:H41 TaxID=1446701 RepID=A0A0S3PMZ6_ECOLX|nr:IS91 ORF2 [Escherichia coli O169:H41]